jgi:hypothetical protein
MPYRVIEIEAGHRFTTHEVETAHEAIGLGEAIEARGFAAVFIRAPDKPEEIPLKKFKACRANSNRN